MGGRGGLVDYLGTHPEVLAGAAVVMVIWYVFGRLRAHHRSMPPLPRTPFGLSAPRRLVSVVAMIGVAVAGTVAAWRADGDVGKSALGLVIGSLGMGLLWPTLAGGTLSPDAVDDGSWRRPAFSWWAIGAGLAYALGCVAVAVRAFAASIDDTSEAVSLVIVTLACTGLGLGIAWAGWRLRLPTASDAPHGS